jgi:hypothetical protein
MGTRTALSGVVLKPRDARGIAFLDKEATNATSTVYTPATMGVLEFTPVEGFDAFFTTEANRLLFFAAVRGCGDAAIERVAGSTGRRGDADSESMRYSMCESANGVPENVWSGSII